MDRVSREHLVAWIRGLAESNTRPQIPSIPIRWGDYVMATNGYAIVGVSAELWDGSDTTGLPDHWAAGSPYYEMIRGQRIEHAARYRKDELLAWLGPVEQECADCASSTGKHSCPDCGHLHEIKCETCLGTGQMPIDRTPWRGGYAGMVFNPRIMALFVRGVPDEIVTLGTHHDGVTPVGAVLKLQGWGWRMVIMPMKADEGCERRVLAIAPVIGG